LRVLNVANYNNNNKKKGKIHIVAKPGFLLVSVLAWCKPSFLISIRCHTKLAAIRSFGFDLNGAIVLWAPIIIETNKIMATYCYRKL
jgi:hypothetical protein